MVEEIIGHSFVRVQYIELNNPEKDYHREKYHNIDFAVQFVLENEEVYHFGWDTTFEQFLLKKGFVEIPPHLENYKFRVWEVENDPAWVPFIGKKIETLNFERIERYWEGGKKIEAPTALNISFENMKPSIKIQLAEPVYHSGPILELKPHYEGHLWLSFI